MFVNAGFLYSQAGDKAAFCDWIHCASDRDLVLLLESLSRFLCSDLKVAETLLNDFLSWVSAEAEQEIYLRFCRSAGVTSSLYSTLAALSQEGGKNHA